MSKIIITTADELTTLVEKSISTHFNKLAGVIERKMNPPKSKFTVKEASEILNVTELTIHNYIKKGFIKAEKIGRRILIDSEELENSLSEVKSLKYRR